MDPICDAVALPQQHCFCQKAPRQQRRPLPPGSEGAAELCVLVTAAGVRDTTEEEEEECQRRREGLGERGGGGAVRRRVGAVTLSFEAHVMSVRGEKKN